MLTCEGWDTQTPGPSLLVSHTPGGYPATGATCVGTCRNALWLFTTNNKNWDFYSGKLPQKWYNPTESFSIRYPVQCNKTLLHQAAVSNLRASWLPSHRTAKIDGHRVGSSASQPCSCGKELLPWLGGEEEDSNGKCYLLFSGTKKTPSQKEGSLPSSSDSVSPLLTRSTYLPLLQFGVRVLAPYHPVTKSSQSLASFQSGYIIQ